MRTHIYDIELFEIFDKLKNKYAVENSVRIHSAIDNDEFFTNCKRHSIWNLEDEGVDVESIKKSRQYIVPYDSRAYLLLLGWKLLVMDPMRIDAFLSYQMTLYSGNYGNEQNDFLDLTKDFICDFIKSNNYNNENIRLEKIMNWVQKNKLLIGISDHKVLKTKLDYAQLKSLHEQLMNTFIDQETQLVHFLSAFEDNPLPYNFEPLIWRVGKNALYELLEMITEYYNKNSQHCLPNRIRTEIVPELFTDKKGHKLTLPKKGSAPSKFITELEAIIQSIQ